MQETRLNFFSFDRLQKEYITHLEKEQTLEKQVEELDEYCEKVAVKDKLRELVVPHKIEPTQNDLIFDKSQLMKPSFFTYYDNTHFDNPNLKETLIKNEFMESLGNKNRFNASIFEPVKQENDQNKPTPFFGAVSRIQSSWNSNPFGINFEIPPLPQVPQLDSPSQNDSQQSGQQEYNFFSFVKTPEPVQKKEPEIQWISQVKDKGQPTPSNNYNRRQVKQKFKKQNRKQLIWELMPKVDETLLDHNMTKESGIKRMWEDEYLNLKMRDLRINETGLLTQQKTQDFRNDYLSYTQEVLEIDLKREYSEYDVVSSALLMLQGIPSQIFFLEQKTFTFSIRKNVQIKNYSMSDDGHQQIFEQLMEAGSFFLHLREFTEFMSNSHSGGGMILQNFVLSIQDFLIFYQNQVNNSWKDIETRRCMEHQKIFFGEGKQNLKSSMTILELGIHMSQLTNQIRLLASICFTKKFIQEQKTETVNPNPHFNNQFSQQQNGSKQSKRINVYNKQNLLKEFQFDIDQLRNKKWLQEFPKGCALLSYLYKILLCCESDLQAVDLLRKIFSNSIEPLLQMINSFVFTGDFEDPFSEFFVEKIYRRSADNTINYGSDDYLFKMTSEPQLKIPIFLIDTASTIFKAGSTLHLLRKQGLRQTNEGKSVKEYYEICTSQIEQNDDYNNHQIANNQKIFKIYQFDCNKLQLVFQINKLKQIQEFNYAHFQKQLERLQSIEMAIVKQEEQEFYRTFFAIQEAKQEFIRKRQEEEEAKRVEKQRKKDAFMKEIEIQRQERQEQKEKEKQLKQQEKDEYKKQQEEYEMRKKAIEQELLRQYEIAIRENQRLGDMRQQEVIRQEQMDKEYHELIEQYQNEEKKQEQTQQLINTQSNLLQQEVAEAFLLQQEQQQDGNDHKMEIDEIGGEVPMDNQKVLKDDEEKLLEQQLAENNPLLSIINETLQKAQENLSQSMIILQDQQQQPINNEEEKDLLKMDEIKLLQSNQQSNEIQQSSETQEDKIKIINELFFGPLLKNVFDRIEEIKRIETKRKTWNQKRKVEKIMKVQEMRSKWKYQGPQISVRDKLNSIFEQFDEGIKNKEQQLQPFEVQNKEEKNDKVAQTGQNAYNVPVGLAIRQCTISVVKEQYKLINKCLIHMMFRKLQLMKHLEVLRSIFFCFQGDVITSYMQSLFNEDIESTIKENSLAFINGQFELAVKTSMSDKLDQVFAGESQAFGPSYISDSFKFELINIFTGVNNPNFYFTAFNLGDFVKLTYERKYPIDLIISDQCIEKYNQIFFFLIKLKRINFVLSSLWKYLHSTEFKRLPWKQQHKIRRVQLLRNTMQHFVSMLEQYALNEVIQAQWALFKNNLMIKTVFEDLVQLHNDFLDQIMLKCFISTKDHRIMAQVNKMFSFVLQFNKIVKDYGPEIVNSDQAIEDITNIQDSFEKYTFYMYEMVKHLAHKGYYKELYLLLDFNKYYDKDHNTNLNIEAPFIKIVQECIVKSIIYSYSYSPILAFKSHKKFIEKEVSLVANKLTQIKKTGSSKGIDATVESIDQLIQKLNHLKSKYNKMIEAEDYLFQVLRRRLQHLNVVNENQMNPEIIKDYFTKRLNRIIIDFLLRENRFASAKAYIDETGLKDFCDLEVFEEASKIISKLKHRDCSEALGWCNTHKTKLQKSNSQLEFKLRVQEFIELIKNDDWSKAVDYSKKQLQRFNEDQDNQQHIQRIMGLIALKRINPDSFKFYTDEKRWREVEDLFMNESYQLFGQPQQPIINNSLQVGISVLKTEFCNHDPSFNEQCPTCSSNIRKLGQKLPFSHSIHTSIQCGVTGELMNDQNQPLFLPTGFIVSERALEKISDISDSNKIVCPYTKKVIKKQDIRKVFFS